MKKVLHWLLILAVVIGLSACGGGGGNNNSPDANKTDDNGSEKLAAMPLVPYVPAAGYSGKVYYLHGYEQKVYLTSSYGDEVEFSVSDSDLPIDGNMMTIPEDARGDKVVTVHAVKGELSGDVNVTLRGLTAIELIDENITAETRLITDPYGIYKIQIDEEASIPVGTNIHVLAARRDNGLWLYRFVSSYEFKANDLDILRPADIEMDNVYGGMVESPKESSTSLSKKLGAYSEKLSGYDPDEAKEICHDSYATSVASEYGGWYNVVGRRYHLSNGSLNWNNSAVLCSKHNKLVSPKEEIPILFIHGYNMFGGFGGGKDTWGKFPKYMDDGTRRTIYEFRWRTNTRFQDAAGDLCMAINYIYSRTGKTIHLVAHSFGGVLARTYLEGLAGNCHYEKDDNGNKIVPIASLTTLGSPHSGLDKSWGGGYDDIAGFAGNTRCKQISCYQMGDDIIGSSYMFNMERGEITTDLLSNNFYKSINGSKIPVQVLMGTSDKAEGEGDGLISLKGQRFSIYHDGEYDKYLYNNAWVTQKYLKGVYWHNGFSRFKRDGNLEAYANSEWEDSVLSTSKWIDNHPSVEAKGITKAYVRIKVKDSEGKLVDFELREKDSMNKIYEQSGDYKQGKLFAFNFQQPDPALKTYILIDEAFKIFPISNNLRPATKYIVKGKADLEAAGNSLDNPLEEEYTLVRKFTRPTKAEKPKYVVTETVIKIKKEDYPILNSVDKKKIEEGVYEIKLYGENFDDDTQVTVGSYDDEVRHPVGVQERTSTKIVLNQGSAPGYQQVCVQKMVDGAASAASCKPLVFEKIKNDRLKIDLIRPGSLMASSTPQHVTISGVGFTPASRVHWRTSSDHGVFQSGTYIDDSTMTFDIRTKYISNKWTIWVENPMQESNHITIDVDTSNKPDPTKHRPVKPILLKPGGYKYAVDRIPNGRTTFTWEASAGAKRYWVCYFKVRDDPNTHKTVYTDFKCQKYVSGTKTSTTFDLTMEPDQLYAWQMAACASTTDDKTCNWSQKGRPLFMLSRAADTTPPEIDLNGDNPLTLTVGDNFVDPGASAYDYQEDKVVSVTVISNTVDTSAAGTYEVVYQAIDSSNNKATKTRVVKVIAGEPAAVIQPKKTGQTKSYDTDGNEVTDDSLKDDGHYQAGVEPNYTRDESAEVVIDHTTGLMWQDNEEAKTVRKNWSEAKVYCQNLEMNTYKDWRLPTRQELFSIVKYDSDDLYIDSVFRNTANNSSVHSPYWSSSANAGGYSSKAWEVSFYSGHQGFMDHSQINQVRCVRHQTCDTEN